MVDKGVNITLKIIACFVLVNSGKIKALHALDKFEINQPEGMLFTPSGDLYIASEGNKQNPGRIMSVQLKSIRD
ncbi:MAG: hypothetical protein J7497_07300 [Chitinophagaceae bacterium]|nr:hypothetical protein [Chitinophagaceae bacterium]